MFWATTATVVDVPLANPVMTQEFWVASTAQVETSLPAVATYPVTSAAVPFSGAVHDTVTELSPARAVTPVGA